MTARLYTVALSNPGAAAAGILVHTRTPHRVVKLPGGAHPLLLRAAGFRGWTVPALELANGRRLQGSLAISRALNELAPERPLFPRDRAARRAVEDAESWGHSELQPVPRRILRWGLLLLAFTDLVHVVDGRPGAAAARRLFPRWEGPIPQFSEGSAGIVERSR